VGKDALSLEQTGVHAVNVSYLTLHVEQDHDKAIVLPHLGASTEEAEDEAASMAADTIREYIEHGTSVADLT